MFFYLHYVLMTSGLSGVSVLLAVYFKTYTDASQGEIGILLMSFPFLGLIVKPLFCSMADRKQAHRRFLLISIVVELIGYAPFAIIPFFPPLYENHPRACWYLLTVACLLGNGGLGVGWSLGDCLAMNMSQKKGTPFGRMRLMGTVSWGIYGFIIGQINEVSFLPKYVPAFLILHASLIAEILLIACWSREDFEMVDPKQPVVDKANTLETSHESGQTGAKPGKLAEIASADSVPSSAGGTLRLRAPAARAMRDIFVSTTLAEEDLARRLKLAQEQEEKELKCEKAIGNCADQELATRLGDKSGRVDGQPSELVQAGERADRNPQLVLLKMLVRSDGRIIKYVCIFTVFGFMLAPMNFVFLSMETVCHERGYNFSQLAGAVLISQAGIESLAFYVMPLVLRHLSRSLLISAGLLLTLARYFFYANWYYQAHTSPYWAVLAEWGHGIPFGIICVIQAELALQFANQSSMFIGELRKLGFLSDQASVSRDQIEAEERSARMALRATMQALFGGFMDGAGQGFGALTCGLFIEIYSYVSLWRLLWITALVSVALHQLIELTRSRWSDTYTPAEGTKAYEIMRLSNAASLPAAKSAPAAGC